MSVGTMFSTKKEIPAHARFEVRTVENVAESRALGKYVAKDVDYVIITPPYSEGKESIHQKVKDWMLWLDNEVSRGAIPSEWRDRYKTMYQKWKEGQEMPLDGTPIKGWGVIAPAQQAMLIQRGIHTVEELAQVNDTGLQAIGMGAQDLKNKAMAWLAQLQDKGQLTQEMAALKRDNAYQAEEIATLTKQVEELKRMLPTMRMTPPVMVPTRHEISARDILTPPHDEIQEIV